MTKRFWRGLALFLVVPGLLFVASCAKKPLDSEPGVSAEQTDVERREAEERRALEEERLREERLREEARRRAEERIALPTGEADHERARAAMMRSLMRLKVAEKRRRRRMPQA